MSNNARKRKELATAGELSKGGGAEAAQRLLEKGEHARNQRCHLIVCKIGIC